MNAGALAAVYSVGTSHAPAAIRPDPDLFVRQMIRQYRPEGTTVATQIGLVGQYAPMLGGASEDFSTPPAPSYDATSLLAVAKVADQICQGLVAPDAQTFPGWTTILPNPPDQEQPNILWLAQRISGKKSSAIDATTLSQLTAIMVAEEPFVTQEPWAQGNANAKYVPVCSALTLSAEALFL